MTATKEQELKALEEIKKIVEGLGKDSYVGAAFDGCFTMAEYNIANDFMCSYEHQLGNAYKTIDKKNEEIDKLKEDLKRIEKEKKRLEERFDDELCWKDHELDGNVKQEDYRHLFMDSSTRFLTDDEAKELLYSWFGFAKEKIKIRREVSTYQINRHGELRKTGSVDRKPAYNATDWNYIRFDCGCGAYEMYNDEISLFTY